jgi:hypothetical protein
MGASPLASRRGVAGAIGGDRGGASIGAPGASPILDNGNRPSLVQGGLSILHQFGRQTDA